MESPPPTLMLSTIVVPGERRWLPLQEQTHHRLCAVFKDRGFSSKGRLEDEVDYTVFAFDGSGRVEEVFGQVVSAKQVGVLSAGATVSSGDGLNFLKLSNAQIAMLKGKGLAEIEASFGKPTAVRESQPLKMLNYSDALPPGKSYRKRIIGINAEGKVAEVDDGYEFRE